MGKRRHILLIALPKNPASTRAKIAQCDLTGLQGDKAENTAKKRRVKTTWPRYSRGQCVTIPVQVPAIKWGGRHNPGWVFLEGQKLRLPGFH